LSVFVDFVPPLRWQRQIGDGDAEKSDQQRRQDMWCAEGLRLEITYTSFPG
jgi:hypothetical protein